MRRVDDAVNAFRRIVDRALPWYSTEDADERRAETRTAAGHSIRARIRSEAVIAEYRRADRTLGR